MSRKYIPSSRRPKNHGRTERPPLVLPAVCRIFDLPNLHQRVVRAVAAGACDVAGVLAAIRPSRLTPDTLRRIVRELRGDQQCDRCRNGRVLSVSPGTSGPAILWDGECSACRGVGWLEDPSGPRLICALDVDLDVPAPALDGSSADRYEGGGPGREVPWCLTEEGRRLLDQPTCRRVGCDRPRRWGNAWCSNECNMAEAKRTGTIVCVSERSPPGRKRGAQIYLKGTPRDGGRGRRQGTGS